MMKNLPLGISIVSLISVIVLYVVQFSPKDSAAEPSTISNLGNLKIAYINFDSTLKYYDYYKVVEKKFESKKKKIEQDFQSRTASFQNEVNSFRSNYSTMTIGQADAIKNDLAKKEQNLIAYEQGAAQELQNDQMMAINDIYEKVTEYLKIYGPQNGIEVILKYTPNPSSDVLYGSGALDITQDVVKGLNEAFKAEATKAKKDSTATRKN